MVLCGETHGISDDCKTNQGESSVPVHLAARFNSDGLALHAVVWAFLEVHADRAMQPSFQRVNFSTLQCHCWWWEARLWEVLNRVSRSINVTFHHWWMVLRVVVRGEPLRQSSGLWQPLIDGFSSKNVWELRLRVGCESSKKVILAVLLTPHPPFVPSNLSKVMATQAPTPSTHDT